MGKKEQKGTILVGNGEELLSFFSGLKRPDRVLGIFCDFGTVLPEGLARLGEVEEVPTFLDDNVQVQRIYCSTSRISVEQVKAVQYGCKARAVRFCAVLPIVNQLDAELVTMQVADNLLLTPRSEPLSHLYNRLIKRVFDLFFVLPFMLLIFPFVYLFKAMVIKRKKRGPSFSFHRCCGPNSRTFNRVSFRGEENSLARVFNVLIGSMSLVGPACFVLGEEEEVVNLPKRLERKEVKSGMTGWAQVNNVPEEKRLEADIWYVEHWSVLLDLRILLKSLF